MIRASVVLKILLSQTFILHQNSVKEWEILGHCGLWAVILGIYCENFCGKISAAPLNILSSVCCPALQKVCGISGHIIYGV